MSNCVNNPWSWRIATTESGLGNGSFRLNHIPVPTTCFYQKRTVENPQSDGRQAVHGYQKTTISWGVMNGKQYKSLKDFIESQRQTLLYLTIDRGDGTHSDPDWIDISGHPYVSINQGQQGPLIGRRPGGKPEFINVVLILNNVTVLNDPSLYTVL